MIETEKNYIISETELLDLLATFFKLQALDVAGVDNWSNYGNALSNYQKEYGSFYESAINELINYQEYEE